VAASRSHALAAAKQAAINHDERQSVQDAIDQNNCVLLSAYHMTRTIQLMQAEGFCAEQHDHNYQDYFPWVMVGLCQLPMGHEGPHGKLPDQGEPV
jgi:hypothetical protein